MWRNLAKQASSRKFRFSSNVPLPSCSDSWVVLSRPCKVPPHHRIHSHLNSLRPLLGFFPRAGQCCPEKNNLARPILDLSCPQERIRAYVSVAEAIVSEEDSSSGCDEVQELIEEVNRQEFAKQRQNEQTFKQPKKTMFGMGITKYHILRKRQVKMEIEAWEEAAKEYQELLADMCEHKLAPNLPYMKSLFLGWFEPLRNAISADQEMCKEKRVKPSYAPFIDQLPADKMAVLTMHKLMGLLMTTNGGSGSCRVVQAACQIGEAIEHEALLHKFLEKTKKKSSKSNIIDQSDSQTTEEQSQIKDKEQEKLRKKVNQLVKKQKVKQVKGIVKAYDDSKPWGQDSHVKIGCRVIQLLTETAFIQPPADQLGDAPPDIRPAFIHTLKTITKDAQKGSRRYGVIECDPLVQRGLEKTARHMVIPYMPMLVPPSNWKGYDEGGYLFLPSYIMRTHGARQQREAVKRAPQDQLEPVFEALDTLGYTKWRVNKRVLAVVDRVWTNGGCLAGLVDREDIPLPEEPDTEDESEQRKWKWKIKNIKKENNERHSQRCDTELKLAVARKMKDEEGFYYPHNLDFRGRAYPMHPYLNHLGSDLCRGILEFAEGRPLGESGLRWLKIHLANLYAGGVDKLSYDGRIAFTENHIDDICDSADWPLEGKRWWLGAEDPFQCLAACINLSEALRSSSPEAYPSHMPVHQDGSCNGLQHYAALGRDKVCGCFLYS
ncbi:hypothetical protein SAY86_002960 [Trapa natans]|uniref:DNA-directed RNA polymerase n=1 Tax=Trapa natans TaxID=22666 RepID=A0AAN7R3W3_TRANT|nr:hypothetical protein SAY86_002960 [Trapa natans]